jgi:hypothetical protein
MDRPQAIDRCAAYCRVSTPKQKLEHQKESIERFATSDNLNLPPEAYYLDKVRRHKAVTEGEAFARLMRLVKARQVDWIIVATFDRWGISNKDEIFVWRSELRKYDVQLWSVADELNVTGDDDGAFWRVAARAEAATAYVSSMADKNIQKMVSMAQQGWATSGNNPFGLDLVCYPVNDLTRPLFRVVRLRYKDPHLYRVITYTPDSRVKRNDEGHIVSRRLSVEKEDVTEYMPPRDKKATGYRAEPSVEADRLQAVRLLFQLYAEGMDFGAISEHLWKQGHKHYDRPFGYHGVDAILRNPAYLGKPAFGKVGTGQYKHTIDRQPQKVKRRSSEPFVQPKAKDQWVMPTLPLFPPVVDPSLFNAVQNRLDQSAHVNPAHGKRRTRDRTAHPLNGKIFCPDCQRPMVLGSYMPGPKTKNKKRFHCFVCGTYRKTIRTECNANTVRFEYLNEATDKLLAIVGDRIDAVTTGNIEELAKAEWLQQTELGRVMADIFRTINPEVAARFATAHGNAQDAMGKARTAEGKIRAIEAELSAMGQTNPKAKDTAKEVRKNRKRLADELAGAERRADLLGADTPNIFERACQVYQAKFDRSAGPIRAELEVVETELANIALELAKGVKSATVRAMLDTRMAELETRKTELTRQATPLTVKAGAILDQLKAIRKTLGDVNQLRRAELLDAFIEAVYPILEVKETTGGKRRTEVVGFRFVARKEAAGNMLADEMKILFSRRGTGSSTRPG